MLALTIFTGVGLVSFFVLNGYLLGREYFELAAMRHMSAAEARDLFDRHWLEVFAAGAIVVGPGRGAGPEPAHAALRDRVS